MKSWVFLLVGLLVGILFISCLNGIRKKANERARKLSLLTRLMLLVAVVALSMNNICWLPWLNCMIQTALMAVYVIVGYRWSKSEKFHNNTGGKTVAMAMLYLSVPAYVGILWSLWDLGFKWPQMAWVAGPVADITLLLYLRKLRTPGRERVREELRTWLPQLVLTVIFIGAIVAMVFIAQTKGVI